MRHLLHMEGFGVRLRPVQTEDAGFIVWLRNQDYVKGRVGDSAPDTTSQQKWLETYFGRELDYYFILETLGGIPLGTNGLYDISGKKAEWGRYIVRPEVRAALPSVILIFDLAFEKLELGALLARCVSTNRSVHSFIKKCGFRQTETEFASQVIGGRAVDLTHFDLTSSAWAEAKTRLLPLAREAERRILVWEESQLQNPETPWIKA